MDNKIEVFKNEQFGEIRTALIENEPWFVAVDVCRALEIGNSSQAISRLDADEKMITLISNEGNKRGKTSAVEAVDADAVLTQAAETASASNTRKTRSCLQWRLPETISLTMTPRRKVSEHPRPVPVSLKSW